MSYSISDRWHGAAFNCMCYRGLVIGSGYDCEVRRETPDQAIACVTNVATRNKWFGSLDVDLETDLQRLAEGIATNPWLSDAEHWISVLHPTWERMVDRWSAAKEIAP